MRIRANDIDMSNVESFMISVFIEFYLLFFIGRDKSINLRFFNVYSFHKCNFPNGNKFRHKEAIVCEIQMSGVKERKKMKCVKASIVRVKMHNIREIQ